MAEGFDFFGFLFNPVITSRGQESERRTLKADDYNGDHLGQVGGQELEDEGEGGLGVDDVVQRHNVRVPQLLQQACLSRMGPMSSYLKSNRNNNDQTRKRRQNTSLIAVNGVPSSS